MEIRPQARRGRVGASRDAPKRLDGDASTWDPPTAWNPRATAAGRKGRAFSRDSRHATIVPRTNYLLDIRWRARKDGAQRGSRASTVVHSMSRGRDWCCGRSAPRVLPQAHGGARPGRPIYSLGQLDAAAAVAAVTQQCRAGAQRGDKVL